MKKLKPHSDILKRAKSIVDSTAGESKATLTFDGKNAAAVALGKLGGLKGGDARAKVLTPKRRSEIARKAANVRWHGR